MRSCLFLRLRCWPCDPGNGHSEPQLRNDLSTRRRPNTCATFTHAMLLCVHWFVEAVENRRHRTSSDSICLVVHRTCAILRLHCIIPSSYSQLRCVALRRIATLHNMFSSKTPGHGFSQRYPNGLHRMRPENGSRQRSPKMVDTKRVRKWCALTGPECIVHELFHRSPGRTSTVPSMLPTGSSVRKCRNCTFPNSLETRDDGPCHGAGESDVFQEELWSYEEGPRFAAADLSFL